MALSKRRLISFFLAFLMVINLLPVEALADTGAQEIGSQVLKAQARGAAYTVSLDLQNVDKSAANVDLSSKGYHLYLCLKVMDENNNPQYKYYISPSPVNAVNGVFTSEALSPTESFTDVSGTKLTDAFDIGSAQIVSLGLAKFSGEVIPSCMDNDTAIGFDAQGQFKDSITIKGKSLFVDKAETSNISNSHTLKIAVYDEAIGPYDVLGFAAEFG